MEFSKLIQKNKNMILGQLNRMVYKYTHTQTNGNLIYNKIILKFKSKMMVFNK